MRVVFHIGSSKTGTSSIQGFLSRNRGKLLRQGVLYPRNQGGGVNHKLMAVPLMNKVQRMLVRTLGSDIDAARAKTLRVWDEVRQQVEEHKPEIVVISSEYLMGVGRVDDLAELSRSCFGPDAALEFVAYVRTPSEHFASAVQQRLKASSSIGRLKPRRYVPQLDRYAALGKVTVRKFDRALLKDGSVVADICNVIGIRDEKLDHKEIESNVSLSAEGTILLQQYRRTHHDGRDDVPTADTKAYRERIMREEAAHPGLYTKPRLKPALAQLLDRETDDLRQLRERYGVALAKDHGVAAAPRKRVNGLVDAAQIFQHDPELLERMRRAVG